MLSSVDADFNAQTIRTVIAFRGNGQLRFEFSREETHITMMPANYTVPYELTEGRDISKIILWSVSSEYKISGNVNFSFYYSGRTSKSQIIHNGRLEVRAFF
jgi:hypothetical protein